MKRVIYSGTFDPITLGHIDIINRATKLFDEVVVAVALSSNKKPMFEIDDRVDMVKINFVYNPKIKVIAFDGMLVDLAKDLDINIVIRGIRNINDFAYEEQMEKANKTLLPKLETIFLSAGSEVGFVSSTIVKSVLTHDGDISNLVSSSTLKIINKIYNN